LLNLNPRCRPAIPTDIHSHGGKAMTRTLQEHVNPRRLTMLAAILAALALGVCLLAHTVTANAVPAHGLGGCSVRTLQGEYVGNLAGTSSSGPGVIQVQLTLNGDGTGTVDFTQMSETSGPTTGSATITYTLDSNCSGTLTAAPSMGTTAHFVIAAADQGTKVYLLETDSGIVGDGVLDHV
jgi:hypothetical protein